jgi:hypothetical protein
VLLAEGTRTQGVLRGEDRSGGVLFWLMLRRAALGRGFLIGLSTFQAELDFGVPQFDFLFRPLLIALAASIGLVSTPHFPLYLAEALIVEGVGAVLLTRRRSRSSRSPAC